MSTPDTQPPIITLPDSPTGLGTIRARLILAFALLVLVPILIIGAVILISETQGGRQERIIQLNTVLLYKENALLDWMSLLQSEMNGVMQSADLFPQVQNVLVPGTLTETRYESLRNLERYFSSFLLRSRTIDEFFLVEPGGIIFLSTHLSTGSSLAGETYFQRALIGPTNSPPLYDPELGETSMLFLRPIFSNTGDPIAVIGARADMGRFQEILSDKSGLGRTGESFLVGQNRVLVGGVAASEIGEFNRTEGVEQALSARGSGSSTYENFRGTPVLGVYRYIPEIQAAVVAEQTIEELMRSTRAVAAVNTSVALTALIIALFASLSYTRSLATPLSNLAETATRFASGEHNLAVSIDRADEIGVLGSAFNAMTAQLRDLIANLEQRVADRTEQLTRRTLFLEASTGVTQAAASVLDPALLIHQVVELIRDRFDLYYVGLFLLDEERRWAVLRAGTGTAGQLMLNRGHRLEVGGGSMIGWSVARGQARIALRAGEDPVRLATPELPETRAEAAIPLRSRGNVIGALTVQSAIPGFFDEEIVTVLQAMADQIAIALDNAHLLTASQEALEAERRAYGELSREAWSRWIAGRHALVFQSDAKGVRQLEETAWSPLMADAIQTGQTLTAATHSSPASRPFPAGADQTADALHPLSVPIKVRGQTIGVLNTLKPAARGAWTGNEIEMLETITDQLAVALDSARLYSETQLRAERERLVSRATANMRATLDVENVLQTAANEIFTSLQLEDVTIWLSPSQAEPGQTVPGKAQPGGGNDISATHDAPRAGNGAGPRATR